MQKLFLLLFLAVNSLTFSQNSITGSVLDQDTNQPVIGATVYIPEIGKGTNTNLDGNFSIPELPSGTHELVISAMGFSTRTLKVTVPSETHLEILVATSAIEMEEVIISTPFHQLQSENVMKVERATVENLTKAGSINITEGITQIPGVESMTTGAGIGKPVIRGLSSNRVLVFTQGVRLENQQFGGEHGLGLNSSGIGSVEVIKGPASLLYGSDALGGVLYFNPESYAIADSTRIDAQATYFTNTQGMEANAGFKTSSGKLSFLVRGNYGTHSDYETGDDTRVTNTRFNEWDLKTGMGYRNSRYRGDLRYNLNVNRTGIPEEIGVQSTSKELIEPYQETENHVLSIDNKFYFDNSSLDVKIGYLFNDRNEFEDHEDHLEEEVPAEHEEDEHHEVEPHGEEAALQTHLETLNYDAKYNLPQMGNFETIVGIQGMFQSNTNFGEEILIPDAVTRDFGILATTHYHLEKIDFQTGIRYDTRNLESEAYGEAGSPDFIQGINRTFNSYNGAIGAKFNVLPSLSSRINLASGFRAPNLAELTSNGSHHGSNRYEVGNSVLDNEQNFQLDLALEYTNEHFEVFANAFYNAINNYIYLEPTGEIREENPVFNYIQNNAKLYGGETGMHIHPHPLDWFHIESSFEIVVGKRKTGEYLPLIPAPSFTNTFRVEYEDNTWLDDSYSFITLKSTFGQDRVSEHETPSTAYTLLSAGVGGTMDVQGTNLQLRLSGKNLLNKTYTSHLSRLKPDGIYDIGRNITLSAKVYF